MNRIKSAAIQKRGKVYVGRSHSDIIHAHPRKFKSADSVQGFVTETGRFVDRMLAAEIAFKAKQIPEPTSMLFSEDLTGDWPRKKKKGE